MLWDRIGHMANRVPAHMAEIIEEHRAIVDALDSRDAKRAATAMKLHLKSVDHAIARLKPEHADYFVDG
jgi:DNA-binding FadR family transcriptional regulator